RDLRGDVAEVAQRRRRGGDERPRDGQVGRQLLLAVALLVPADDPLVEVVDVEHRQVDALVGAVDRGAVTVVVEGVLLTRLVHGRGVGCGGNHVWVLCTGCVGWWVSREAPTRAA